MTSGVDYEKIAEEWADAHGDDVDERSDEDRRAEAVGIESDIRYCACGCGTKLPSDGKFAYKRGHKMAAIAANPDWDPEPGSSTDSKTYSVRITKKVREDIEGKVGLLLTLVAMGWAARDPLCGGTLEQNVANIAEKSVPLICKSPELVKWLTRTGNVTGFLEFFMALWPVIAVAGKHHIMHSIDSPGLRVVPNPVDFQSAYPVD